MRFVVSPKIFELYPGLKLPVVVAQGLEPTANRIRVEKLWREAWEEAGLLASTYANAYSNDQNY